jgi:tetratricopeptide (TPR) repeat protein
MWDLAVREADYGRADSLLHRLFPKPPLVTRAFDAFARLDSAQRAQMLDEAAHSGSPDVLVTAQWIATYLEDLPAAEQFARLAITGPKAAGRASAHLWLGMLELAKGRWRAAGAEFASAERLGAADSARHARILGATLPFLAVPQGDLSSIRTEIEQWLPSGKTAQPGLAGALGAPLRLYLLGLLNSRLGADTDALRSATELARIEPPPDAGTMVGDWAHTVRADVASRHGRYAEALGVLGGVRGEIPLELVFQPVFRTQGLDAEEHTRYIRAELLYDLGREEEARRWFEAAFQFMPNELVYRAPSHLRLGEIYEHMGERSKAADHYSRFIRLWKSCDPELQPMVAVAKARLAALVGEPVKP